MSPDFQMVFPGKGGVVLASTRGFGLIRSSDDGLVWQQSMFTNGTFTSIVRMNDGALVASVGKGWGCAGVSDTSWGVYRSENEGLTWAKAGVLREQTGSLVVHPSGAMFAGTDTAVYRSTDAGKTWKLAGLAQGNVNGLAGAADGRLYAAIGGKGLFRSSDEGITWKGLSTMFIGEATAVVAGAENEIVALGSEQGAAIRSTDQGQTWVAMNKGLIYDYVHSLTLVKPYQYVCAGNDGAYLWDRTLDEWKALPTDGLSETYVNGFAHGPSGHIYAWTYSGMFRSTRPLTDAPIATNVVPGEFRLEHNYPNPFNGLTNVGFRIADFGLVKIAVYDILGRELTVLVNEKKERGTYEARWDASGFPSGVYICRMIAGEYVAVRKMNLIR